MRVMVMGKRTRKIRLVCKNCGANFASQAEVKIGKTWYTVSPFPDKEGNVIINIFAIWFCPKCGAQNKGKIASIRDTEAIKSKNYTEKLKEIIYEAKEITLNELAKKMNISEETLLKALRYLIKEGIIKARLDGKKVISL